MENLMLKIFAGSDGAGEGENNKPNDEGNNTPKDEGDKSHDNKPTDAEAKLLKEVMAKKSIIQEQEAKMAEMNKTIEAIKNLGGLDELTKIVQERKDAEQKSLEARGEWDKLKAQMVEAHKKTESELQTKIKELTDQLSGEKAKIDSLTVGAAFANSAYLKEKTVLPGNKAQAIYGSYFDIDEAGKLTAFDKPRGAQGRTMLVDGDGNSLAFESAIEKIISLDPDHDSLLRSVSKAGAGSGTMGANVKTETKTREKTGLESIAEGIAKGLIGK